MTPAESKSIYEAACKTKRMTPVQEEGAMWHKSLKGYEASDVRSALDAWWASTDRDSKGDLKSQWMPAPGELIPLTERAKQQRVSASTVRTFVTVWVCGLCRYRATGFYPKGSTHVATCPHCDKPMQVFHRDRGGIEKQATA